MNTWMARRQPAPTGTLHLSVEEQPLHNQPALRGETAAFFIKNSEHPDGRLFHTEKPEHISCAPAKAISRPPFPEKRQAVLQVLEPCTFFVQYPCLQKCRSLGICVHFQLIAGCRSCPDGLRCPLCVQSNIEEAIEATRKCPLHQEPAQANPISNRPEDFLATRQQRDFYEHILQRSFACFWDDVLVLKQVEEDRLAVPQNSFQRDVTPRDLRDIQMLETIEEHGVKVEDDGNQVTGGYTPTLYSDPLSMGVVMPQLEVRQSVGSHPQRNYTW